LLAVQIMLKALLVAQAVLKVIAGCISHAQGHHLWYTLCPKSLQVALKVIAGSTSHALGHQLWHTSCPKSSQVERKVAQVVPKVITSGTHCV